MGIKENFSQAVRELTGGGKDDKKGDRSPTVDGMRNAVAAEDTGEFNAVRQQQEPARDDFEEIERRAAEAAASYNRRQGELEGMRAPESAPAPQPQQPVNQQPNVNQQPEQNASQPQAQEPNYGQAPSFGQDQSAAGGTDGGYYGGAPEQQAAPVSFSTAQYSASDDNEITIISKNTVIDGNIRSFANMNIDGNIKGNVETTKDIDLNGKVVGNITCNNAALRASQVQGNIQMKGNVFMERDTLLIGDITSTYANVNGKVKGNLDITGKAELKSDAVVFGDISASTITVNDGAIIQGYVSTTFLNKEESKSIFPDTITIGE